MEYDTATRATCTNIDKYQKLAIKWKKASYKDYNEY